MRRAAGQESQTQWRRADAGPLPDGARGSGPHPRRPEPGTRQRASWAKDALLSIAGHRRAAPFDRGDGRYPLTFGPPDAHPAGRLIRLNDSMGSTYRVRDGQILQVNRMAGPKLRFTIDMLENLVTEDGRYLPRAFTVSYFQVPGGALSRSQTFRDEYRKVGGYLLPASRLEITAEDGGTEHASLKLDDVRLLP